MSIQEIGQLILSRSKCTRENQVLRIIKAAFANKWDKQTSAVKLACSLRGSAAAILSDSTPEMKCD